jgi:hypothetical protein
LAEITPNQRQSSAPLPQSQLQSDSPRDVQQQLQQPQQQLQQKKFRTVDFEEQLWDDEELRIQR